MFESNSFLDKLNNIVLQNNSLVCVGLDTKYDKIPEHIKDLHNPIFEFNRRIIDATADLVCAYKPNSAFYEAYGQEGIKQLKMTFDYLGEHYPEVVTVLDAKRADIGNTNNGYVAFAYEYLQADSITLHPYLGKEALAPFLARVDKGNFILCKTSNQGSGEFQNLVDSEGKSLYQKIAESVENNWNENSNCGLVTGATYPEELEEIRKVCPKLPFLVPGIGAQGGDVEKTVKAGLNSNNAGMLINSSRGIIFASSDVDFAEVARQKTFEIKDQINQFRLSA
jgi:orotidine-5'-phosphate decarboxylase